jgi:hypothetical protein
MVGMGQDESISALRLRVSALVTQEAGLLEQAFELSREGADRRGVDALFAQVQALQVERNSLQKRIAGLLGDQRLHAASEVWRPGVYEYCEEVGGARVRVQVTQGPLGLQVLIPGREQAVRLEALDGTFDGPLGADAPAARAAQRPRSAV